MIGALRKRFVIVSTATVAVVFAIVFACLAAASIFQLDSSMDKLTAAISENGGEFPDFDEGFSGSGDDDWQRPMHDGPRDRGSTRDTQFSTRYFVLFTSDSGGVVRQDLRHVSAISPSQVGSYATEALRSGADTGWVSDFRYLITHTDTGDMIVFVNGERERATTFNQLGLVLALFLISFAVIFLLIFLVSKRVVKPIAESYDRQKQFVTNASHELKTPLTIMLSDLDIVESEVGENEWIGDIRAEGKRMGSLINQLVSLARMDEEESKLDVAEFDLSELVLDVASEFEGAAKARGETLATNVAPGVKFSGDEQLIYNLMGILMDNAVKYCDAGGSVTMSLSSSGKKRTITVENSYEGANKVDLKRIFERFYREDKARTSSGSFGIGLSMAEAIAKAHHGSISSYAVGNSRIGFKVELKSV